ncbi:MAG: HlyD family type I secretion periplasmic adaptor subunit [Ideonella sp.]|nr:HlyD family type I secretion periplasmic adaptor subunit [Ideonella sp.]
MSKEKRWRAVLSGRGGGLVGGGGAMAPPTSRPLHVVSSAAPPKARWRFWPFSGSRGAQRHRPVREEDLKFLDAVQAAQQVHARPGANAALYLIVVGVAAIALWATTTQVEQITRTEARVVPEGREQVISSLEGGILRELMVREGAQVTAGQPLARLDPTRFEAQQSEGASRLLSLKATLARLKAEAEGRALAFPDEVLRESKLVNAEADAFIARRRLLAEAIGANQTSIALVQRELNVAQHMSERGLMSEVEVMRLKRQINDMRQQSLERANRFRQEASTELLKVQAELAQLEEQMVARKDVVQRTVLNSPVDGLVKNIRANTLGGVVGPGAPIMEIVPKTARLLVEAKVKPADIGFVRVGQTATMKLSAYEFNLYGGLTGKVESISPDALGEPDKPGGGPDATWFRALVSIDTSTLQARGKELPIIPGMTGTMEINTGQRSVADFVLRPLMKAKEAFRER